MEIIKSSKGGDKICYNGYMYTRKANKANRVRWQCCQKIGMQCKGAITTSLQVTFKLLYYAALDKMEYCCHCNTFDT